MPTHHAFLQVKEGAGGGEGGVLHALRLDISSCHTAAEPWPLRERGAPHSKKGRYSANRSDGPKQNKNAKRNQTNVPAAVVWLLHGRIPLCPQLGIALLHPRTVWRWFSCPTPRPFSPSLPLLFQPRMFQLLAAVLHAARVPPPCPYCPRTAAVYALPLPPATILFLIQEPRSSWDAIGAEGGCRKDN